jgi:3-oxoacyl-[acyl-carrier-protein] synthase-1
MSDAHIVAIGARTPVGGTAMHSAAAIRARVRRLGQHPFMLDGRGNPLPAALDGEIEPKEFGVARIHALARSAVIEAARALSARAGYPVPLRLLLALPESRPGFSDQDAAQVAQAIAESLPPDIRPHSIELTGRGHAGALDGVQDLFRRAPQTDGEVHAIVAADSYFHPDTVDWLDSNRQIASEGIRSGFIPGEAAGCVVVASTGMLHRARLPSLATVRGAHSALEANVIRGDTEVLGRGLTEAVRGAVASLRSGEEKVDDIYCDINGERYRTEEWVFTVLRTQHALRDTLYEAAASCWGDVGAASGALGCILAIRSWARNYATGTRALVWGSSEGGLRSAVLLERGRDA